MANLFNLIKPRGVKDSLQRNHFDLSQKHAYSQKVAKITPLKCVHTVPKDFFDVNVNDFTQTTAMQSAPFLDMRKEISSYFVPYNFLWSNYNQYQATREDPKSAALSALGIKYEPRIPLWVLYLSAYHLFYGYCYWQFYFQFRAYGLAWNNLRDPRVTTPQPDVLTSDLFKSFLNTSREDWLSINNQDWYFGLDFSLVDGKIDWFEHTWFETSSYRDAYQDVTGSFRWSYFVQKLDMLGYGNLYPLFDNAYRLILECFERKFTDYMGLGDEPELTFQYTEELIQTWSNDFIDGLVSPTMNSIVRDKIIPHLRVMCQSAVTVGESITLALENYRMLEAYPLYAYNHVFYHMFRNTYYDLEYSVHNYSLDFLDCKTLRGSVIRFDHLPFRFFDLESHQYKKDIFTGVLPDVQFGVVSSVSLNSVNIINDVPGDSTAPTRVFENGVLYVNGRENSQSWNVPNAFDVLALKRAEMLQVYHQNLMRAGNRTSDIFKAIYGSDPKSELHHTPYFVEVLGEDFEINPVISTAETGNASNGSLGDIASRFTSRGSRSMKFSTEDFGCLLFLSYVTVDPFYNSTSIDPCLMNLTPEDHLIPELMNLGFSPVLGEWLSNYVEEVSDLDRVRGYAPPYLEFKSIADLNSK